MSRLRLVALAGVMFLAANVEASDAARASESLELLTRMADRLRAAVLAEDIESIIAVVADRGVACTDSYYSSRGGLREQYVARKGPHYEILFDTAQLRSTVAGYGFPSLRPGLISFKEYFKKYPESLLVIHGDGSGGVIQWMLSPVQYDMDSPRFGYAWNASSSRYEVNAIGCN